MQDNQSRMTILTAPKVPVELTESGTLQVTVEKVPLKIRLTFENVDKFHKNAKQQTNYFEDLMKRDFLHPIEAYRILP